MKASQGAEAQDRRVRRTRKAIHDALQTLLQDRAIEQISVKDLADAADIGYTTFFRHFATKEDALGDLADSEAAQLIDECFPLLRTADSRAACLELCRHIDRKRRVWFALLSGGAAGIVREALVQHTVGKSGDWPRGRSWLPAETGASLVIGLVVEVLGWWLSSAQSMQPEQVAEIMDRLFIAALVGEERQ